MSDAPADPLLLLIQRISESQIEQGKAQVNHTEEQHKISLALAILNTRLEPLTSLSSELTALRIKVSDNTAKMTQHSLSLDGLCDDVESLKTANDKRSGWEGMGGTALKVLMGALIPTVIAAALTYGR